VDDDEQQLVVLVGARPLGTDCVNTGAAASALTVPCAETPIAGANDADNSTARRQGHGKAPGAAAFQLRDFMGYS